MISLRRSLGVKKLGLIRWLGAAAAWSRRSRWPSPVQPGTTVVIVTWNSLPFLRDTLTITKAMSPRGTRFLVVDNASSDGTPEYLAEQDAVEVLRIPVNVGHGVGLDLAMPSVETEYVAVLDVDSFPLSDRWLDEAIDALEAGQHVAGAHMHRNFIHPCFLVTRTALIRDFDLTFRPVGTELRLAERAPFFLDVGEALSQRIIIKFRTSKALHRFEITECRGPGLAGAIFGGLVYHNMYATQGHGKSDALNLWREAIDHHHPDLLDEVGPTGHTR